MKNKRRERRNERGATVKGQTGSIECLFVHEWRFCQRDVKQKFVWALGLLWNSLAALSRRHRKNVRRNQTEGSEKKGHRQREREEIQRREPKGRWRRGKKERRAKEQEEIEGRKEGMERHLFCVRDRLQADSGGLVGESEWMRKSGGGEKGQTEEEKEGRECGKHYRDRSA